MAPGVVSAMVGRNDRVEGGDEPTGAEHGTDPISCSWRTGAGGSTGSALAARVRPDLVIAALVGVPVAVAAAAFMRLSHGLTTLVWTTVPDGAGWTAPPWWYVLAVPAIARLLVAVAVRLPGRGGEPAVAGNGAQPPRRGSPVPPVTAIPGLRALATVPLTAREPVSAQRGSGRGPLADISTVVAARVG